MNYHIPSAADMQDIHNKYKEEQFQILVDKINTELKEHGQARTNQWKTRIAVTYARLGYDVQEVNDFDNICIEIKLPIFPPNP
jgi:hypothetical protein